MRTVIAYCRNGSRASARLVVAAIAAASSVYAAGVPEVSPGQSVGLLSAEETETFFDPLVRAELDQHRATGIAVAVVRNGQVLFARGYGYADAHQRVPIDVETTPFRVGSISKTLTAAAVMQLVEAGKLRLDEDIGVYLGDFPGRRAFGRTVTLEHLLSHTSGFDERNLANRLSSSYDRLVPWREYSISVLPQRLYRSGERVRYSNHNATLAGYIIEAAAHTAFTTYISANLLVPLRMGHSSFARPTEISTLIPAGHILEARGLRALPGTGIAPDPAASLATSAADISRFMIAMTSDGQFEGRRVLTSASIAAMERVHFESAANPAAGLGLWRVDANGVDGWEHVGDQPGFVSAMLLIPSARLGFFASANSSSGFAAQLKTRFIDRYFPAASESRPAALPQTELDCYTGTYRTTYFPSATIDKTVLLLGRGPELHIGADARQQLQLTVGNFHDPLRQLGVGTFRNRSGYVMRFRCESGSAAQYVGSPYSALERLRVVDRYGFQASVLAASIVLLGLGGIGAYRRRPLPTERALRWLICASALGYLAFLLIAGAMLGGMVHLDFMDTGQPPPPWLRLLLAGPLILTLSVLAITGVMVRALLRHEARFGACASCVFVLLASLGLGWLLNYWNLLPWRY